MKYLIVLIYLLTVHYMLLYIVYCILICSLLYIVLFIFIYCLNIFLSFSDLFIQADQSDLAAF